MTTLIQNWRDAGLEPFHAHLAQHLCRMAGEGDPSVRLAVALTSHFLSEGHTCFDLRRPLVSLLGTRVTALLSPPNTDAWLARLGESALVQRPRDAQRRPLVLDAHGRLYLQRYHAAQEALADQLRRMGDKLHIVSGGPGSGKTTQIARQLLHWIERWQPAQHPLQLPSPRILALAPTGKAASRLKESLDAARSGHNPATRDAPPGLRALLPSDTATVHRALGLNPLRPERIFRHADNPLNADIVVVDECSMVDLLTMLRLLEALAPDTRLLLVGDRHQLSSVEAGAVFGDICLAALQSGEAFAHAEELVQQFRFSKTSVIAALARCIKAGDAPGALAVLHAAPPEEVRWVSPRAPRDWHALVDDAVGVYAGLAAVDPLQALAVLDEQRLLTPLREGPLSVASLNQYVARRLLARGALGDVRGMYPGRPVMVVANDYATQLFNGDTGVVHRGEDGHVRAVFAADEAGAVRAVSLGQMPAHETVYAMTVHKSQGSEMNHVLLLLPETDNRLLSRELLYTAVTRARQRLTLYADAATIAACIQNEQRRMSGLVDALVAP